jgi:hypothetical protein
MSDPELIVSMLPADFGYSTSCGCPLKQKHRDPDPSTEAAAPKERARLSGRRRSRSRKIRMLCSCCNRPARRLALRRFVDGINGLKYTAMMICPHCDRRLADGNGRATIGGVGFVVRPATVGRGG